MLYLNATFGTLKKIINMIKTEKCLINITYRNITYFKNLNYDAKIGESIFVNVNDL